MFVLFPILETSATITYLLLAILQNSWKVFKTSFCDEGFELDDYYIN